MRIVKRTNRFPIDGAICLAPEIAPISAKVWANAGNQIESPGPTRRQNLVSAPDVAHGQV